MRFSPHAMAGSGLLPSLHSMSDSSDEEYEDSDDEEESMHELAASAHRKAQDALARGDFGTAYACFLLLLKVNPGRRDCLAAFATSLLHWSQKLCGIGRGSDAVDCCKNAVQAVPVSAHLWYAYGACLMHNDMRHEALTAFLTSIRAHPDGLTCSRWSADTTLHGLVERWHYPMLNDVERNTRYAVAISRAVQAVGADATVLEIGCGTGLLSMLALRSGLKHIHGVEMSPLMFQICRNAVAGNGCSDSVSLRCLKSTSLTVPGHLPQKASLLITEIMDCALLGEHIVPTLRHAWQNLLLPPPMPSSSNGDVTGGGDATSSSAHGRVIPRSATVHAVLMECPAIRLHSRLVHSKVMGVDFRRLPVVGSDHVVVDGGGGNAGGQALLAGRDAVRSSEPYSTECVANVRGGAVALQRPQHPSSTAASQLLHVNFSDPRVPVCVRGELLEFVVDKCGVLDTVVVYFDAEVSEGNVISTNPFTSSSSKHSAWQQASFPVTLDSVPDPGCWERRCADLCECCRALEHAANCVRVCTGDCVVLSVRCTENDTQLAVSVAGIKRHAQRRTDATASSENGPGSGLLGAAMSESPVFLERTLVARLNDTDYCGALELAAAALLQSRPPSAVRVLDLSHGLPLVGVGILSRASNPFNSLVVLEADKVTRTAVERLVAHNDVQGQVQFASMEGLAEFDIVFADLVSPLGFLYPEGLGQFAAARKRLAPGGVTLPQRLELWAMCIDSAALRSQTAVLGSRPTLGIDVARYMNAYQVGTFVGLDMATLECTPLSDAMRVLEINLDFQPEHPFSTQTAEHIVSATAGGELTAVVYWFRFCLTDSVVVENHPLSSQSVESHWRQSAVVLPDDVDVTAGQSLHLVATVQDGCVGIRVTKS